MSRADLNGVDDGDTDINLSGESSAYFDNLTCNTFQNVDGSFFTGITSNIQTQINGISGGFVTLTTPQTITATKTFTNSIIPRRSAGDGTDLQISNNAMQYRQSTSTNNIGIGLSTLIGDSVLAGQIYNTGSKNIAIGNFALQKMDGGSSCVAIGFQSMQNVSQQRIYGAGIFPSRCIGIGENTLRSNLYGNDQIAIGHNSMTNVSSGNSSICIGTNAGNGLTFQSDCVLIGAGNSPSVNDNGIVSVGALALGGAVGQFNSGVAIGYQSFYNNNNASANTGVGAMSGLANTTGNSNTCLGCFSGRFNTANNLNSTTTIGYASSAEANREFVVGGNGVQGDTQYLTLPLKNRLNCCQFTGAVATYTINWRSNEYVIVNTVTTTLINLPQAIYANSDHVGACFHIVRTHLSYTDLTIAAFGTEKINFNGSLTSTVIINNWVGSISFVCVDNVNGNGVWAVRGYQPRALLATDANKIQTLTDSTNVNYPMCFTTISNGINYFGVLANSNLTYNPSTGTITAQNINVSSALTLPANSLSGACLTFASIDPNKVQNLSIDGFGNTFLGIQAGSNFEGESSIAIGNHPLVSSVYIENVIAIGNNSGYYMEEGSFSVFIGNSTAGGEISSASTKNTYIGYGSVNTGEHHHCTALGAETTINNGLSYSMALGYGVNCDASNQIKIGTNTETVEIDGGLVVAGTFRSTGTFRITNYRPYEVGAILNNAVALPGAPTTLFGSYTFQSGVADAVVILPIITVEMIGCAMGIRRIVNNSFQLIIKTAVGSGATIVNRDSTATTATNTNYVLLNTLQYMTTIMPISTTQWVVISVDVSETVTLFGSNPNPTVGQSIPFSGIVSGNHQLYVDNTDLNFTESTQTLRATNVSLNDLYVGGPTIYSPYESKLINSNGNMSTPLVGVYYWTGAAVNNINLPVMTAQMVGARVIFARTGTSVVTTLTINRSGTDVIYPQGSGTPSNTIVLLTTSGGTIWRNEIFAVSLGFWAVLGV